MNLVFMLYWQEHISHSGVPLSLFLYFTELARPLKINTQTHVEVPLVVTITQLRGTVLLSAKHSIIRYDLNREKRAGLNNTAVGLVEH